MNKEAKNIKLVDVAEQAGVSAITVSRTIRTPNKVSKDTLKKVNDAINKLGYVPDPAASALASHRTDVIALLVPSLTNNVFADVLSGISDSAEKTPYSLQMGNYRYSPSIEEKLIRSFLRQKPSGIIVAGMDQTETSKALLQSASCPVIQIMDYGKQPLDMSVGFSHTKAAQMAVEHLLQQGYRYPAFLGARMDPRSQQRLQGFKQATQAANCYSEQRVITTPSSSSVGLGTQLFTDLIALSPETDAILCNNDDLATGALLEAQRCNIKIPSQLGICGFNDLELSKHLNPSLSSVATPLYEIGKTAFQLVLDALQDKHPARKDIDLGAKLMPRASTDKQGLLS